MNEGHNFEEQQERVAGNAESGTAYPSEEGERSLAETFSFLTLTEGKLFLLLAVLIGLFSGLAVVCFRICIDWVRFLLLGSSLTPTGIRIVIVPAVAGLVVAFLVQRFFRGAQGSGVNQTKAAVYVFDGYVPFRTVFGKFITCALAIGSGQSLGPEDPSLQMGAGMASALGRRLSLSREKLRLLAPVGAAAGLAAAFNAPLSAILFVIEEVIGTWSIAALGAIVLAAVSSVVVMRLFLGSQPLFGVPAIEAARPIELLGYAVLGVVSGLFSLAFGELVGFFRPRLRQLPQWTQYLQPAAAGLLIGLIGLLWPQVMGAGYPYIDQALHDQYAWQLLAILGLAKIVTTSLSFVSGTPGGMFAPTLFIGATIGGAIGGLEHHFFPQLSASVAPFALVGIGAFFAGFLRVPITSVFMVLETTGSYSIVLPVIISNTIAYLIARTYQKAPLFDMLAKQDGLELPSMEEQREQVALRVEDAVRPATSPPVDGSDTAAHALAIAESYPDEVFLVSLSMGQWSYITKRDLREQLASRSADTPLQDILRNTVIPVLHPDQSLDDVLRFIHDYPLLPVVSRAGRKLEGTLSLDAILAAYQRAP